MIRSVEHAATYRKVRRLTSQSFTLVEMLVVIAVISILSMLLMPSLSSALDAARRQSCLNNIYQAMQQVNMYLSDFNGRIAVVDTVGPVTGKWESWGVRLYQAGLLGEDNKRSFNCCMADAPDAVLTDFINYHLYSNNYVGHYLGQVRAIKSWRTSNDLMFILPQVKTPSRYVFMLDGKSSGMRRNGSKLYQNSITNSISWAATPWTIHSRGMSVNTAFVDGHVSAESCATLIEIVDPNLNFVYNPLESW